MAYRRHSATPSQINAAIRPSPQLSNRRNTTTHATVLQRRLIAVAALAALVVLWRIHTSWSGSASNATIRESNREGRRESRLEHESLPSSEPAGATDSRISEEEFDEGELDIELGSAPLERPPEVASDEADPLEEGGDGIIDDDDDDEEAPLRRIKCNARVQSSLSDPLYWLVRKQSEFRYLIKADPLALVSTIPAYCLSQAVFSARLVSSLDDLDPIEDEQDERESPITIRALPVPVFDPISTSFVLSFSSPLLPVDQYLIEVRLEFGFLEGGLAGSVCGDKKLACAPGSLPFAKNTHFVGKVVEFENPADAVFVPTQDGSDLVPASPCSTLSPLPGYWRGEEYHPTLSEGPCSLVAPTFPPPFPTLASPRPLVWISLIGDSNTRALSSVLSNTLGLGPTRLFINEDPGRHKGTLAMIAFKSSTGVFESGHKDEEPDILLTWQWFFQTQGVDKFKSNAQELTLAADGNLADFLQANDMTTHVKQFRRLRSQLQDIYPTRTYISLGSHAEELTHLGSASFLSTLLSPNYLSPLVLEQAQIRFFTTTFVKSDNIPLGRFPSQDLIRNNAVIRARNEVLKNWPGLEGRVIDVEALTDGIWPDWMKSRGDAVHFLKHVYKVWASLVWTDLSIE